MWSWRTVRFEPAEQGFEFGVFASAPVHVEVPPAAERRRMRGLGVGGLA
jgi:hypothetical protein